MISSNKLNKTKISNCLHKLTAANLAMNYPDQFVLTFAKHNPWLKKRQYAILEGFLNKLLKNNSILTKLTRLFLPTILKGSSNMLGFKKVLCNRVTIQNHRFNPSYNRRKHNHSHHIIITNQLLRLSKSFQYLGKNKLKNFITFALKKAIPNKKQTRAKTTNNHLVSCFAMNTRAIPHLITILETQVGTLLWRNQFRRCLTQGRQTLLHGNSIILLKNWANLKKTSF